MNCVACGNRLEPWEIAQPMLCELGEINVPSACDSCCRTSLTKPGSKAGLDRLVRGEVDKDAADELARTFV